MREIPQEGDEIVWKQQIYIVGPVMLGSHGYFEFTATHPTSFDKVSLSIDDDYELIVEWL